MVWKILGLIHIVKNKKACSEENTRGVAEQPFDKEIMGANHRSNFVQAEVRNR